MAESADLKGLAARLSADLTAAQIPHAISGSVAMAVHGFGRTTFDVDVLVVVPSIRLPAVFDLVRRHGFSGEDRELIAAIRERTFAQMRRGPLAVDVIVPAIPYHQTLLPRSVHRKIDGQDVPFVSVEDLIVLKMLWRRAKDVPDVHALAKLPAAALDKTYVRETLASILPHGDPRLAEIEEILRWKPA